MDNDTLIFLVQSLEQPRVIKRILSESKKKKKVKVYAFRRKIYRVNNYKILEKNENLELNIIGTFDNKSFFWRFVLYLKLYYILINDLGFKKNLIYSFGLDMRFISFFIPNKSSKYEVSDIMWLYKSLIPQKILSKLDFFLCKRSLQVIFTSKGFHLGYYSFLPKEKYRIIENKFKTYNKVKPINELKIDKIRIAYIGAFRYPEIIDHLIKVCKKHNPRFVLNFYGDGPTEIISRIKAVEINCNNIHYNGAFKNPDDLEKIYSENNVNFVAYDNKLGNEKVAMPNKFYESGFFNIPIVGSKNTFVGSEIAENGMGWIVDPTLQNIECFLTNLTVEDILEKHNHIKNLSKERFQEV